VLLLCDNDRPCFLGDRLSHVAAVGGWEFASGLDFLGICAAPAGSPRRECGVVGRDPCVCCVSDDMDEDAPRRSKYSDGSDGALEWEMSRKGSA